MKASLDHLPGLKRIELPRVIEMLTAFFTEATATKTAPRLKGGLILKSSPKRNWLG